MATSGSCPWMARTWSQAPAHGGWAAGPMISAMDVRVGQARAESKVSVVDAGVLGLNRRFWLWMSGFSG